MLHLIPQVRMLEEREGSLRCKAVQLPENVDSRILKALEKLPVAGECAAFARQLQSETWEKDEYRQELLLAAQCTQLIARLLAGESVDTEPLNKAFSAKWLQKNKPSELFRIQEMLTWLNR